MTYGLLQLVAKGQQDEYIHINPDISYFKYAYKKHTNFSMDSIQLTFDINPILNTTTLSGGYLCKVHRYGDLLKELYFSFELPAIYSTDKYKFRWIENVGSLYIKKATISVGGVIIDTITGEWLNIKNEFNIVGEKTNYNKMTGNYDELINPKLHEPRICIINNKFYYTFYPSSDKSQSIPSIPSKRVYIPLSYWFTKSPALSLPLLKLQYSDIYITIEPEISENLYQVYSSDLQRYISPIYYNELYNDNININTFIKETSISPYIEANYIFLDNEERISMISTPKTEYLVEQLEISSEQRIVSNANTSITIELNIHKPTKELIWTTKRDDYYRFNERNNYTASFPESSLYPILNKATIMWNKSNNRIEEKTADYFNKIQPYQHHEAIPKEGIYAYSFALFPEKETPSGSFNAAVVSTGLLIYTNGTYNNDDINNKLIAINRNPYQFDYLITVYSLQYNVYEIVSGIAAMKFA